MVIYVYNIYSSHTVAYQIQKYDYMRDTKQVG